MRDMKKDLIVAVIMIAIMAGVILMPWQAYYVIGALALVGVRTLPPTPPQGRGVNSRTSMTERTAAWQRP